MLLYLKGSTFSRKTTELDIRLWLQERLEWRASLHCDFTENINIECEAGRGLPLLLFEFFVTGQKSVEAARMSNAARSLVSQIHEIP